MSIFNLAKNLIKKPYVKRKLKLELVKFDETIKEMLVYESINSYVRTIAVFVKEKNDLNFFSTILKSKKMDSNLIKEIAASYGYNDLVNKMPINGIVLSDNEVIIAKKMLIAEYNRPNLNEVENIAFSGGGAKGIAHVGTLRTLDEAGLDIKAVSGTSAGAITALPYALGYSPNKIAEIVSNYDFTSFLQESILHDSIFGKLITKISTSKRALMCRTLYFDTFARELEYPLAKFILSSNLDDKVMKIKYKNDNLSDDEKIEIIKDHLKSESFSLDQRRNIQESIKDEQLDLDIKNAIEIANKELIVELNKINIKIPETELKEKLSLGFKNHTVALNTFFRINRREDVVEEFFGDLIENKIKTLGKKVLESVYVGFSKTENMRNMTFKDFEKLRELLPDEKFKNLGICICQKLNDNPMSLFDKDNYKQIDVHSKNEDPEYANMSIKVAVRISMNLPGAFSSYVYKGKKYVDGGVRANFPLHFFDKTLGIDRSKTLGFALAPEDNYTRTSDVNKIGSPETPVELIEPSILKRFFKKIINNMSHYYNHKIYGQKLDNNNPMDHLDFLRVGFINVLNIGTNDFNISKSSKSKIMQQGYITSKKLLSPDYEAQINHYRERIRAINKKIKMLKSHELMDNNFIDQLKEINYSNIVEHENNKEIKEVLKEGHKNSRQNFKKRPLRRVS